MVEIDLELADHVNDRVTDVRKLEVFAPRLRAELALANTSDEKLFIFGFMNVDGTS